MSYLTLSALVCLWMVYFGNEVSGNCSGGVTSQSVHHGDSGLTELILRKVPRPLTCTWEVTSPTNGLHLDLTTFIIPDSKLCLEGSVQITVGEYGKYDSVALEKWCGEFYPRILQLAGHVTITLRLQPTESRAGFKIKFTSLLPSQFCSHPAVNLSGSGLLYSPGFGGHWSVAPSLSCDWQISASPGHVVQIELLQVDFSQWACSRREAELVAYDGNAHSNVIGSWCKSNIVGVAKSSRDSLHLTYINQVPHRGPGFLLKYYKVKDYNTQCAPFPRDLIARSSPTFISMLETPRTGDAHCRWNITTEQPGDIVVMETVHQNLGSIGCIYVELRFFDGDTPDEAHLQRRVCSGIELASNNVIESSGSHAYLELLYNAISPSVEGIRVLVKVYSVPRDPCRKNQRSYRADRDTSRLWISPGAFPHRSCDISIQSSVPNSCVKVALSPKDGRVLSLYDFFDIFDGANASSPRHIPSCSPEGKAYTFSTGERLLLHNRLSPLANNGTAKRNDGFWLDFSADSDCEVGDFEVIQANNSRDKSFFFPAHQGNASQTCRYLIKASRREVIQLHVTGHPTLVSSTSNCTSPPVVLADDIKGRHVIGQWCSGQGDDYVSQSNRVYIQYTYSERSVQPSIVYRTTLREQCHEFLTAPQSSSLTLTSPYFPVFYPNNADCTWSMRALRANYRVEVRVLQVNMGPGDNCSGDYVALHAESGVIRLCKPEVYRRPIRSRDSVMQIDFHSDGQITDRGFKFSYRSIKSYQCNESLQAEPQTGTQRFISSPFFPGHYSDAMRCSYLIQTSDSRLVETQMDLSDLGGLVGHCVGDSLTFYDGRDVSAPVIGRACGSELVKYRSTGRFMYLVFQSDEDEVTHRGFQLQYYSVFKYEGCEGARIGRWYGNTSRSGYIPSPFYPRGIPQDTTCRWRVYVGSGYQVQISVNKSDISSTCLKFQVKFYDGAQSSSASLGSWCGGEGRVFTSSDNVMTITMNSHTPTRSGFKLAYIATGTGPAESRTALVLGIIIGAVVLVVIISTVIIVCCCCCTRNKKKDTQHERKDTMNEKRETQELTESLRADKPSPDEGYKTHLITPSAPPMEGTDNSGFPWNNPDATQTQSLYPDLASVYNALSPKGVPGQMMNGSECPSSRKELAGEIRGGRADSVPLVYQRHVRNTCSRPGKHEVFGPGICLVADEDKMTADGIGEADINMGEIVEQKQRWFERTQAQQNPIINCPYDENEPDNERRNIKNGKKIKIAKKKDEKKLTRKSDKRLLKEDLKKKSSIECYESDPEELHISDIRSSRARQHCDDNGPYPNGSSPLHDMYYSCSQRGNIVSRENWYFDWNNSQPQDCIPNYFDNAFPNTSPCYHDSTMDVTGNYHPIPGLYHYTDQNPTYHNNPSQNVIVHQHQVQVDVHPCPVVSQYSPQNPVHYRPSLFYQSQGNIVDSRSCFPNQSCNCNPSMTSVPIAPVPQHIWSTGHHLVPQGPPKTWPTGHLLNPQGHEHIWSTGDHMVPPGPAMIPAETVHSMHMLQYNSPHRDIRPVPILVPIHEGTAKYENVDGVISTTECLTRSDKSTGTDPLSELSQVVADISVDTETPDGEVNLMPPHPSHLADLLPPSHWIRSSLRRWPGDIPCTLTSTEEKSDGSISFEEKSVDQTWDQSKMKHNSDIEKNNPLSANENEVNVAQTKENSIETGMSISFEGQMEMGDIETVLDCQGDEDQESIDKDIEDVHQEKCDVKGDCQEENEQGLDADLSNEVFQNKQVTIDPEAAALPQEENEQDTCNDSSHHMLHNLQDPVDMRMAELYQEEEEQGTGQDSTKDLLHRKQNILLRSGFSLEDVHNLDETTV